MTEFEVQLPSDVWAEIARRSGPEPGAEAAWVLAAVREKLAMCSEMEYLEARAARGNQAAFDRVLAKVPAVAPDSNDQR